MMMSLALENWANEATLTHTHAKNLKKRNDLSFTHSFYLYTSFFAIFSTEFSEGNENNGIRHVLQTWMDKLYNASCSLAGNSCKLLAADNLQSKPGDVIDIFQHCRASSSLASKPCEAL